MKKRKLLSLVALLAMLFTSCGGTGEPSSTTSSSEEVSSETISSEEISSSKGENHDVLDLDLPAPTTMEEDSIMFHYWRKDGKYSEWDMWIWEKGSEGAAYSWNAKDDWGVIAHYPLSNWSSEILNNNLGFIVRKGGDKWLEKDLNGGDMDMDFDAFEKDENGVYHLYLVTKDPNVYIDTEGNLKGTITMAVFPNANSIAVSGNTKMKVMKLFKDGVSIYENASLGNVKYKNVKLEEPVDLKAAYEVEIEFDNGDVRRAKVSKVMIYDAAFDETYKYEGDDLGANVNEGVTTFKVWSPVSKSIKLRIYDNGTPTAVDATIGSDEYVEYEMDVNDYGLFSYQVNEDLSGKYYTYVVTNFEYTDQEIVDPYAKSCGVNGLRGMIVDFASTNPEGWDNVNPLPYDRKELTVYETHVADVTSSSTWTGTEANRKLFKGMYESGTTYTENDVTVTTGFDHIKELGVNAVQIIPFYDQANDEVNMTFNWGYNPLNYNCLEGGYSSNPHDGYARIREFKELVKAYNEAGINIIMDVVYNHTSGATGSNFDVLVPGYYYRYDNKALLSNGSGCGNETASENFMMRKFMIDSVNFWTREYKLGGFRFDLMGLHDLETMEMVTASAKTINENIVIYGEPWNGGTSTLPDGDSAKQINGDKYVGYGAFNDQMRDALIKGGLSGKTEVGWITDNAKPIGPTDVLKITRGIQGTTSAARIIDDPDKTVNYVTCHDNYTLYDRAIATGKYTAEDDAVLARMNVLANSVVMLSQGTSFMLAGEEFLRTKQGNENSYNATYEENELDYSLKIKHPDMFEAYQKMIALKQNLDGLHLGKEEAQNVKPTFNSENSMISYTLTDTANGREYKVFHVNALGTTETFDLSEYQLYYSTTQGMNKVLSNQTSLDCYETLVVYK